MRRFPASVAAYGKPGGGMWAAGDRIVLTDLAASLEADRDRRPRRVLHRLDRRSDRRRHGRERRTDHARRISPATRRRNATPVNGTFLGHEIISMPPPSSGGIALIEMLNILEALEIQKKAQASPEALHLVAEAMRRAYLDRARFLGDPDFVDVPVARLTSKAHARDLAKTIDPTRASSSAELGKDIITAVSRPNRTTRRTSRSSTRTAWPSRTPTRSKAATDRTSSSRARASCSTTRWATSTRSRARRTSRATSARRPT